VDHGTDTDNTAVSTLTGGTVSTKELSPLRAGDVKQWVKIRLFPKCPLLNGDTYDTMMLHDKLADFLELTNMERLEYKDDMRRLTLRHIEQVRHNAKTAVRNKIKGKSSTGMDGGWLGSEAATTCTLYN